MQCEIIVEVYAAHGKHICEQENQNINNDDVPHSHWQLLKPARPEICHAAKITNNNLIAQLPNHYAHLTI